MLVLDASILIRAVLGTRVRTIIATYGNTVEFLPRISRSRKRASIFQRS
jgi:hypothetical protein